MLPNVRWSQSRQLLLLALWLLSCSQEGSQPAALKAGHSTQALASNPITRVKKINTVPDLSVSSNPQNFVQIGSTTYFSARSPSVGDELWKSDGTPAGTVFVKDLRPGNAGSEPRGFIEFNGKVYFLAEGAVDDQPTFWTTDGTAAGTVEIPLTVEGRSVTQVRGMAKAGGQLFLIVDISDGLNRLVRTDGTAAGTIEMMTDPTPTATPLKGVGMVVEVNGALFCTNGAGLWKVSQGATTPTFLKAVSFINLQTNLFANVNGVLFFRGYTDIAGEELWRSDGTPNGTAMLKDLRPGSSSSSPTDLVVLNGMLYFTATGDPSTPSSLWRSDGTAAGTVIVRSEATDNLTTVGQRLFFMSNAGLWKSDGTIAGTELVRQVTSLSLLDVNGTLFFRRTNDSVSGDELWKSDGTTAGTVLVRDILPGAGAALYASRLTALYGKVFFPANDGVHGIELWVSDGTEAGTVLFKDIFPPKSSSNPGTLVDVNGTLFFTASDGVHGNELWKTDGTDVGTTMVKDIANSLQSSGVTNPVNVNGTLYFIADDLVHGRELWKSDGTEAGTVLVKDIYPGFGGGLQVNGALVAVNGIVYFNANDSVFGEELWRSDGTEAGTWRVKDILPGSQGSSPMNLASVRGQLLFTAFTPSIGYELWKSDGTEAGTVLLKEIYPGSDWTWLARVRVIKDTLYFQLADSSQTRWMSDGTVNGTVPIPPTAGKVLDPWYYNPTSGLMFLLSGKELWRSSDASSGATFLGAINPVSYLIYDVPAADANGMLFFPSYGAIGFEPWRTNVATAGVTLLNDIIPGAEGSKPDLFTTFGGVVVFAATDTTSGRELWLSSGAGSAAYTRPVQDLRPGASNSDPESLVRVGNKLYFTAIDDDEGRELFVLPVTGVDEPPKITCPATVHAETGPGGNAFATFSVVASDDGLTETPTVSHLSGGVFPMGSTTVTASITDEVGASASCQFNVEVEDGHAPSISCPADVTVEATSPIGAPATWPAAVAADAVTTSPIVSYSRSSGSNFTLGTTAVTATAADVAGYTAACSFNVTVRDTKSPTISCPSNLIVEATSAAGAVPNFRAPTVTDLVTTTPTVIYSKSPISTFALGITTVTATATDGAGNSASCSFTVDVQEAHPPSINCPADVTIEASNAAGAPGAWPAPIATDAVTVSPTVTYSKNPGTTFALGTTAVTATATDAAGYTANCSFNVRVRDTIPPLIFCPPNMVVEATSEYGEIPNYNPATASDAVSVAITYSQNANTYFSLGTTTVTATAADSSGNRASCSFTVRVRDSKPPVIYCPSPATVEATSAAGAVPNFSPATATDLSSYTITYSQNPNTVFPLGTSLVTATATDASGNSAVCTFNVVVKDTTAPVITCPQNVVVDLQSGDGTNVSYAPATATDAVTTSPALTYSKSSGSYFPLGTTTVTVTTTDEARHSVSCSFAVLVRDLKPPDITCPPNMTVEATWAVGATVTFSPAVATDTTSAVTIGYSKSQGTTFAMGTTTVTATAADAAGNRAACDFTITVRDSTSPVITCPADLNVEATSSLGATVPFSATASDAITPFPPISYSRNPGQTFPFGETTVLATATDAAGNTQQCSFKVKVSDTTAPHLTCSPNLTVEATSENGAMVTWPEPVATDPVSTPVVTASYTSMSTLPLGEETVTVHATDAAGNEAQCSFTVTVQDTIAPAIQKVPDMKLEATSPAGAAMQYPELVVTDAVTPLPTVTLTPENGAVLPLGRSTATIRAVDAARNEKTMSFVVNVMDTTAPQLQCPAAMEVVSAGEKAVKVEFPSATATDAVTTQPEVTSNYPSGSFFLPGTNTVTFTARDGAGNTANCQFAINVVAPAKPVKEGGCSQTAASTLGLVVLLVGLRRGRSRRVDSRQ